MDCVFDKVLGLPLSHEHPTGSTTVQIDETLQGDGSGASPLGAVRSGITTIAAGATEEVDSVSLASFSACAWLVVMRNTNTGERSSALVHAFDNGVGDADYAVPSGFGAVKFRPVVAISAGNLVLSITNKELSDDIDVQARPTAI